MVVRGMKNFLLGLILGILVVGYHSYAYSCDYDYLASFDSDQQKVLQKSYLKAFDTPYKDYLPAIAVQESYAGKWLIRVGESYGVFHIQLTTALSRLGIKDTFHRHIVASDLVTDFDLNAKLALAELRYWSMRHKKDMNKVLASYSAGHNYEYGLTYSDSVKAIATKLKGCFE